MDWLVHPSDSRPAVTPPLLSLLWQKPKKMDVWFQHEAKKKQLFKLRHHLWCLLWMSKSAYFCFLLTVCMKKLNEPKLNTFSVVQTWCIRLPLAGIINTKCSVSLNPYVECAVDRENRI